MPDLLVFLVARGIPANYIQVESAFELSSDHSPVIATIGASAINKAAIPMTTTTHTNWDMFRAYINEHINLCLRIKECAELDEATQYFTTLLQEAAWHSTPPPRARNEACGQHSSPHTRAYRRKTMVARQMATVEKPGRPNHLQPIKEEATNRLTECQQCYL
jgi:hypothetical protein